MASRLSKNGIGAASGHKPFWLTGGLLNVVHSGPLVESKLRNLGCGRDGGLVLDSQIEGLTQLIQEGWHLEDDSLTVEVPYFQHEM